MLGIGIDFGTSNCAVALFDGHELRYARLEQTEPGEVMPSALYLARDRSFEVGSGAIEAYVLDNAGRSIRLTREEVGRISVTVSGTEDSPGSDDGAITEEFGVHAFTDQGMPGRLFRGVKRWLGDASLERVRVFDAQYRVVALATPILAKLQRASRDAAGAARATIRIGRPVRYEGREVGADEVATGRMREACGHAGLRSASLHPEPAAAALSFLRGEAPAAAETVLAFDFGGGTLDLCVMRSTGGSFETLATHGIGLGGDEIDRRICRALVFPELGQGARVQVLGGDGLRSVPFPFADVAERLLHWMHAHELNRPDILESIARGARQQGEDGVRLARLYDLITGNWSYSLLRAVEGAKVSLSSAERSAIELSEIGLSVPMERAALDAILAPALDEIDVCVESVLEAAALRAADIDVVVRTGGSSRIPAVARRLEEVFPGRVFEHDPFTSIAAGLAITGYMESVAA